MAQNPPTSPVSPNQKAAIGTAIVVLLLTLFTYLGYWFANNQSKSEKVTNSTSLNSSVVTTLSTDEANSISGTISKVLGDAIEVTTGTGDTSRTITAKIAKDTVLRMRDLRVIPRNGSGEGNPISATQLKVGSDVIVLAGKIDSNVIDASNISVIIYP